MNLFGDFAVIIQLILLHTGLYSLIWIVHMVFRIFSPVWGNENAIPYVGFQDFLGDFRILCISL
jgi:hypothetical protein